MRDSSDTFSLNGAFQRADGADITSADMAAFMDKFIGLVEAAGLGFGGGWKLDPKTDEEWHEHELREAAWQLRSAISTLESEGGVSVTWKDEAEALLVGMGLKEPAPVMAEE